MERRLRWPPDFEVIETVPQSADNLVEAVSRLASPTSSCWTSGCPVMDGIEAAFYLRAYWLRRTTIMFLTVHNDPVGHSAGPRDGCLRGMSSEFHLASGSRPRLERCAGRSHVRLPVHRPGAESDSSRLRGLAPALDAVGRPVGAAPRRAGGRTQVGMTSLVKTATFSRRLPLLTGLIRRDPPATVTKRARGLRGRQWCRNDICDRRRGNSPWPVRPGRYTWEDSSWTHRRKAISPAASIP